MLSLEKRYLEPMLPRITGKQVVDIGCGTGRWLERVARRSPRTLIGIDSSLPMLLGAEKKLRNTCVLVQGHCENLPLKSPSADLILCSFVLSYVTNLDQLSSELGRIAHCDADIFISDVHPETERKLGWDRGFRDGHQRINLQTHWRSLDSVFSSLERHFLTPVAVVEPSFGEPEFAILDRAGKAHLIEKLRQYPAIYILQLRPVRRTRKSVSSESDTSKMNLCGCRIAIGPAESHSADIHIGDGRISVMDSRGPSTHSKSASSSVIDLNGFLVLPGLINSHDHLEFALFPRLGHRKYTNFREWASDIYRPEASPVREHRAVPKQTRLWWGGIRNLLSGVTTVCHHNPYVAEVFEAGFPVRVVRDFGWAHSIPIDADFAAKHANTPHERPFIVHVGEGVDRASTQELMELDRCGALNERTVIVHGLAFEKEDVSLINSRKAALIWCPSSNAFLFGETHSRNTISQFSRVALGSDSSLTGCGDLLDEIAFARNEVGTSAEYLYSQVTLGASEVLRLRAGEGSIRVGAVADMIGVRDTNLTPAETLASISYHDVELVILGGNVQLASDTMLGRLPKHLAAGLQRLVVNGEVRWIRVPLAQLFADTSRELGTDLRMNGRRLSHEHTS